jgi:hypothetical protein
MFEQDEMLNAEGEENLRRVVDPNKVQVVRAPVKLKLTGAVQHLTELAGPLEVEANAKNIFNVFDDGGYRTLLLLTMFNLTKPNKGRLGDDAIDQHGNRYELKTINLIRTNGEVRTSYPGVTTEHTLRQQNVDRYRACDAWIIGVFIGNRPLDVWVVPSAALEPYYCEWERQIAAAPNHELNNPKIPIGFVAKVGTYHRVPGTEDVARPPVPTRYKVLGEGPSGR